MWGGGGVGGGGVIKLRTRTVQFTKSGLVLRVSRFRDTARHQTQALHVTRSVGPQHVVVSLSAPGDCTNDGFVNVQPGCGQMLVSVTVFASVSQSFVLLSYRMENLLMPPGNSMNLVSARVCGCRTQRGRNVGETKRSGCKSTLHVEREALPYRSNTGGWSGDSTRTRAALFALGAELTRKMSYTTPFGPPTALPSSQPKLPCTPATDQLEGIWNQVGKA